MTARVVAASLLVACLGATARGQQLTDPDRPDVTNGTRTVTPGVVQIEAGGIYARTDPGHHAIGSPVTARIGLVNWLEARIGNDGLLVVRDSVATRVGVGDTQLGAKLRLWADPGGVPLISILPIVSLPTSSKRNGLGTGAVDYTLTVLTGRDICRRVHVDVNYGVGSIGSGDTRPGFLQQLVSMSTSVAASESWNPYFEVFRFSREEIDGRANTAVDGGVIYERGTRVALDGGVQMSRTGGTYQIAAFGGLSIAVGHIEPRASTHARGTQKTHKSTNP